MRAWKHRGFTLVELLVVIAIIGVLLGLLVPAVQSARESARSLACHNNLKQLALAVHNYESVHRTFPPGRGSPLPLAFSTFSYLLPQLEQSALHSRIDYSKPPVDFSVGTIQYSGSVNRTSANNALPFLNCPSDSLGQRVPGLDQGASNYASNAGTGLINLGSLTNSDGVFYLNSQTRFRDLVDGTSSTLAFGERVLGIGTSSTSSFPPRRLGIELIQGFEPTYTNCYVQTEAEIQVPFKFLGGKWILGNYGSTLYNHFHTPKALEADCLNIQQQKGMTALSSMHPAGPLAVYCDGHVQTIRRDIDQTLWRALGSREGGEVTIE